MKNTVRNMHGKSRGWMMACNVKNRQMIKDTEDTFPGIQKCTIKKAYFTAF